MLLNHTIGAYPAVRSFVEILVVVIGNYSGEEVKIDVDLVATPYKVLMSGGEPVYRKYADHLTILTRFKLKKVPTRKKKQPPKFI